MSEKYGYADRQYWAWKTIDFPNGTYQGMAHSLAISAKLGLINKNDALFLIDALICAIPKIRHNNGSVEEAFPEEHSFCVTALVAFDILSAIYRLKAELGEGKTKDYLEIIRPLIDFITHNDETHAIISNHLATGVAAIALWNHLSGDKNGRGEELLGIILDHQSEEGWYMEYESADPGYQTLCTYYLCAANEVLNDDGLHNSIAKSIAFLRNFIHPDGSIGGIYGSRNTEVYYPGGLVGLEQQRGLYCATEKLLQSWTSESAILPENIDRENLIPLVNSVAYAALMLEENGKLIEPPMGELNYHKDFPEAGLYVHSTETYYAVVNYKKGGVLKVFDRVKKQWDIEDGGLVLRIGQKQYSTQSYLPNISFKTREIKTELFEVGTSYPSYFQTLLIRLFALTIFKIRALREGFKKAVIRLLITGKKPLRGVGVKRHFSFNEEGILVTEFLSKKMPNAEVLRPGKYKTIHMASSGYTALTRLPKFESNLVRFELHD
ncbi:hypothetical protein [Luteibaculum oceani]|uniref:Uncharacterized protein n=1 Tax=Luteibaculum oceani TaxID=1294296 RepID=A0A5C6V9Q5_9FLAO|nr:hypothetical protein [Luteibaculum oceani]TXC81530.1 hypothetical protein FRX97_05850 [Luteibaculum oceani]